MSEEEPKDFLSFLPKSPGKRTLMMALGLVVLILLCVVIALAALRLRPKPAPPTVPVMTVGPTETPPPEDTATPEPTATQPTAVTVNFYADQTRLDPGQCTSLHWTVENAISTYLNEREVRPSDNLAVCPKPGEKYTLRGVAVGGDVVSEITFQVADPRCQVVYAGAGGMNMRLGPGQAYDPPIRTIPKDAWVRPLAYNPKGNPDFAWVQVQAEDDGKVGWVRAGPEYLACNIDVTKLPPSSGPAITPTSTTKPAPTVTGTLRPPTATFTRLPTNTPTRTRTPTPTPAGTFIPLPGAHPNVIALDPNDHRIFVTGRDSNSVWAIDEGKLAVIGQIPVGKQPYGAVYSYGLVYVANFGSASLSIIDAARLVVTTTIDLQQRELGSEPTFPIVYVAPATKRTVFLAPPIAVPMHGNGKLFFISPQRFQVSSPINVGNVFPTTRQAGGGTFGIAALDGLDRVYVTNRDRFNIIAVDPSQLAPVESESVLNLEGSPYFLAANPDLLRLYLTHAPKGAPDKPDRLSVYQAGDGRPSLIRSITVGNLGGAGGYVAVWPHGDSSWSDTVWVSVDKKVVVYNPDLRQVVGTYGAEAGIGSNPYGIAINPARSRVYVADGDENKVTVLTVR